jgi:hypothetical protein
MDTAVVTGAFTLGGVVVGGALDWARSSIAARRATSAERDQLVTALDVACLNLITETRLWRTLDRPMSKLLQLSYGLLGELPDLLPSASSAAVSASLSEIGYSLIRWAGAAAAKSLPHQAPVAQAQSLRVTLLPLQSEITAMTVRLSMIGDEEVKTATLRVSEATGALVDHITEPAAQHGLREEEVRAALGQLRRARDAAHAQLWRRRVLRRKITPDALT